MSNNTNYKDWDKAELVKYVTRLENLIREENEGFLKRFKWAGNLGQWVWHYKENKVIFNNLKVLSIGYNPQEIGDVGFEFFTEKLHPDDYNRVMTNMANHLQGMTGAYEVEYRIRHINGSYIWYYDRGVVTERDKDGKALLIEGIVFDITEAKAAEQKLIYLSENDILTNTYNRRMLFKFIREHSDINKNNKTPFSLIMFDIDHFKAINDTFGHLAGDQVLITLTQIVKDTKREQDIIFRYGGEEFFMLLPSTNLNAAVEIAKKLHQCIQKKEFTIVGHITVSMGVVEYRDEESVDKIVQRVDEKMYDAKTSGRNNIKF